MVDVKISAIYRADTCGLNTLSQMFHENLPIVRSLSISHPSRACRIDIFGDRNWHLSSMRPTADDIRSLTKDCNWLITFETPYCDEELTAMKDNGCKLAVMIMHECLHESAPWMEYCDLCLCPTELDKQAAESTPSLGHATKVVIPVPCDTNRIPFRNRTSAGVFVHHAGHFGLKGRNGTYETVKAWEHVKSDSTLVVRRQDEWDYHQQGEEIKSMIAGDWRIIDVGPDKSSPEWYRAWNFGDVLIHPTKWDALSLPIQEAATAGMSVVTTRRWAELNDGWFVWNPLSSTPRSEFIARPIISNDVEPEEIAAAVDRISRCPVPPGDLMDCLTARKWSLERSWDKLGPKYLDILSEFS